ncbi:amino acid transporter [Crenobacter cavernae]|uniref:Amino acid transporter n=2 Tax=Crenobacter cavernae TaxID=2290923 RepID=A0ABY0FDH6_9NEIS|nr:amino acid transporter [Crenobacter cavernae]
MMDFAVYLSALGITASQIVGIGPQNAFVIRQGIGRSHILPIVAICIACDILLISAGVLGMGGWISGHPLLMRWVVWLGAAFIAWLGVKSLRSAFTPKKLDSAGEVEREKRTAVRSILVVTLLNPYVWLDTVVLIGSVSSVYGAAGKLSFILGAATASCLWFLGIGLGAGRLAPWFESEKSWRVLDGVIAAVMFFTATLLVVNFGLSG